MSYSQSPSFLQKSSVRKAQVLDRKPYEEEEEKQSPVYNYEKVDKDQADKKLN